MSSLWQIPELVRVILEHLNRKDQGTMAQVCWTIWVNVLPLIWRHIPRFFYVVRLLPEDSVVTYIEARTMSVRYRFTRTLQDVDWERALFHTQHTTEIGVTINDELLLGFISNRPSKPVFPALRRTQIGVKGGGKVPSVELTKVFLPSRVSSIEMNIYIGAEVPAEVVLNSIANDISLPELTRLSVTTYVSGRGPAISQVIRSHQGIQSLTVGLWSATQAAPILQSAAQLPHLHHVSISDFSRRATDQGPTVRLLPRGSLALMTSLKVVGDSDFVDAVLGLPVAGNMESVCVGLGAEDETPIANCFHSIGHFTRLKCLELQLEIRVPWSAVGMLVGCRELEVFRVVVMRGGSLDITGADLERMADALPRLQELSLKPFDELVRGISHMPVHHLLRIATRFRTLRKLCVCVDATAEGNPTFDRTAQEAVANEALEELDVTLSKVDREAEAIAKMFRAWWPRLRLVKGDDPESGSVWAEVNAIIRGESK